MLFWCYLRDDLYCCTRNKGFGCVIVLAMQWHFCLQPVVLAPPAGSKHKGKDAHVQLFYFEATALAYYNCWLFIRQKQEWMDQLADTENKAFGEGKDPQACSNGSECNVQHFIFIYIYIIYTKQQWDPNKCQTSHSTQLQNKDRPTFLNKKNYFALFSVKVQLN